MRLFGLLLLGGGLLLCLFASPISERSALGYVVALCRTNAALTSFAAPCLSVGGRLDGMDGYAVLREPVNRRRTVLTSLGDVTGIEDRRLLDPGAPDFFATAWAQRGAFLVGSASADPPDGFVLALNPQLARSQDRFHIHMACLSAPSQHLLARHLDDVPSDRFAAFPTKLDGRRLWAMTVQADDLASVDPLRLLARNMPDAADRMGEHFLMVVNEKRADGQRRFVLLTNRPDGKEPILSVEDYLDKSCLEAR